MIAALVSGFSVQVSDLPICLPDTCNLTPVCHAVALQGVGGTPFLIVMSRATPIYWKDTTLDILVHFIHFTKNDCTFEWHLIKQNDPVSDYR